MTARVLCLNATGCSDRLTLGAFYRVVSVLRGFVGGYVEVIDDTGERTVFLAARFSALPTGTRKEERVRA